MIKLSHILPILLRVKDLKMPNSKPLQLDLLVRSRIYIQDKRTKVNDNWLGVQEAYIQRDATAQHARRIQKEQRVLAKLLKELTAQNKKFLLLRDTILPEQKAWKKQKEDDIAVNFYLKTFCNFQETYLEPWNSNSNSWHLQALKQKMQDTDTLSRESTNETYKNKSLASRAVNQAYYLEKEGKSLRAKLKYEREWKRKTQEEIWAKAYDACVLEKGNRRTEKLRRAQEHEAQKKDGK